MNPRAVLALGAALLAAMALYTATHLRVGGDITHFLPADADARHAYLSRALATSELTRTMILAVGAPDGDAAVAGARDLAARLRAHPEVRWMQSGLDDSAGEEVYRTFFPRRSYLLADAPERELCLTDACLGERARDARRRLGGPASPLVARTVGADPLLSFVNLLDRMSAARQGTLTVRDGHFVSADGRHAVIFLGTRHTPFDPATQRPLLRAMDEAFAAVDRAHGGSLTLQRSGLNRFAVASERRIRGDVERISVISTVGIVALFLLVHRSLRYLFIAVVPLAAGMLLATTVGLLVFGSLHGLTLAFGSSLIGVCFDYPVYVINHHTLFPEGTAEATLARVWRGLRLGAVTTIGGLAGLAWASFPGLRELALFSAVGVAGALLATRFLIAPLMPREPIPVALQRRWADGLARAAGSLREHRARALVPTLLALAVCAVGLPRLRWVDDARVLTEVDPGLQREDEAVRAMVSRVDGGQVVVSLGDDDEQALRRNDAAYERLRAARDAGSLGGFRSLHTLLWSQDLQRRNRAALLASPGLAERLPAAFASEGFRPGAFAEFARDLREPPPPPLVYDDLRRSSLAELVRPFRVEVGARVGYLTFLSDVRQPAAVQRAVSSVASVEYFDQGTFLRATYERYRRRTLQLVGVGLLAVFGMIYARYRRLGRALSAFVPAVLASATALAVVGLLGVPANLLHLLGVLLVLSMGADYGIFVTETATHPRETPATLLSVVIACVATVLSFGLLAMSTNPALRAIGLTTGIGMTSAMLLAPLARLLLDARSEGA